MFHMILKINTTKRFVLITNLAAISCIDWERTLRSQSVHGMAAYRVWRYQNLYIYNFPPEDEHNDARNMSRSIV